MNKFLSAAGVCSRRAADELIAAGRVTVDGVVVREMGSRIDEESTAQVAVDGEPVAVRQSHRYYMLHKPVGYLTTLSDPQGRPTIADLIVDLPQRVFPVGRLDADSSGLLLLTTDGDWAQQISHPSHQIPKRYEAVVSGRLRAPEIEKLEKGVFIKNAEAADFSRPRPAGNRPNGYQTQPAQIRVIEDLPNNRQKVEVVICEGHKRQVRKMLDAVGHPVAALHRAAVGNLTLGNLRVGDLRRLKDDEVRALC